MILPTMCSCIHLLYETAHCHSGSDIGLGAYPCMHSVKASEIPWTECLSITMCTKKQTNNSAPWGLLQS